MNTSAGAEKLKQRYSTEERREFMRKIGSLGGKAKVKKGFATMTPEQHKKASAKGGKKRWSKEIDFKLNYEEVK